MTAPLRIGIDIGGTFTDFVIDSPASHTLHTFKLLSTPKDPAAAVLQGLERILSQFSGSTSIDIIHGSTVATNALLERKGAPTALVTTAGFQDVLEIGRQQRPALYDLFVQPPPALIPRHLRLEVHERVEHSGEVSQPLDPQEIENLLPILRSQGVESVAVCLLFSFLHPAHEQAIASRLRQAGLFVSVSSEILPEYREYERSSAAAINAYVSPALDGYLARLEAGLHGLPGRATPHLAIMQSNGGIISPGEARQFGLRCILSGPAGGVIGAGYVGRLAAGQPPRLITFDMGGTSTDVSLIDGLPTLTTESEINGLPVHIPVLDIHTIGAGGGSIAALDRGGALRVGPQSAGADPGPACYNPAPPSDEIRPLFPTVTDANLVLGRLDPAYFLGGAMPLNLERAQFAMQRLGAPLGLDAVAAALGVVAIANAHMERALRVISVERGHDPRDFTLLSFGGAGGLHAADLAHRLGISQVLVPPHASTLSALGMLAANIIKDYTQTVMLPGDTHPDLIAARLSPLLALGRQQLMSEGVRPGDLSLETALDVRYTGQSYELTIPCQPGQPVRPAFELAHHQRYGYTIPGAPVQLVNVRVRAIGRVQPPELLKQSVQSAADPHSGQIGERPIWWPADSRPVLRVCPVYHGQQLSPGQRFSGPALILRPDTAILVGPADRVEIDAFLNVQIFTS